MPKILFGPANKNIDVSEYRDGISASIRNCYRVGVGGEEHFVKTPGLSLLATTGSGVTQGFYVSNDNTTLCVAGGFVYEIYPNGTYLKYTGVQLNTGVRVVFAEDFNNVFIAHGGTIAKLDTSLKTVSLLGSTSPSNVTHVTYQQGYLLCNGLRSGGISGDTNYSDDSASGYIEWESFNNERLPDGCNAVVSGWDAEVYSFGPRSLEVSYNDGTTPWAVLQGAFIQYGCLAPYSVQIADNTLFWLTEADSARRMVKMVNRAPQIISTPYDELINSFSRVDNAVSWLQQMNGYSFYMITFPSDAVTLAYKIDDGQIFEMLYWNTTTASYEAYRGHNAIYVRDWNKTLIGDRENGKIYTLGGLTDNGEAIRMEVTSGQMEFGTFKDKKESMLYFRVKRGYEDGGTFQYRVRDNNGPWKNEKSLSLGSLGTTKPYLKRPSGGVFRSRQYQIIHSDKETDFIFMGLENDIQGTGR